MESPGNKCPQCSGTGFRATARTANGRDLERHERSGTRCSTCNRSGTIRWRDKTPEEREKIRRSLGFHV